MNPTQINPGMRSGAGTALVGASHHHRQFEVMGAHVVPGGTRFTVWAPNARAVGVIGSFNGWDGQPLERIADGTGRWSGPLEHARAGDCSQDPEWNSLIFNSGRYEVRDFLISNALFWLEHYHFDALRVDAVASMLYLDYARRPGEWLPNPHGGNQNLEAVRFLQDLNSSVYAHFPDVHMIAEESTAWPGVSRPAHHGGLGFGMKWNMGWMNDTLRYTARPHFYRRWHGDDIRFSAGYACNENFVLPLSHDEVVYGAVCNLTPQPYRSMRVGVPHAGDWYELLNSDAAHYGGSGWGNLGRAHATSEPLADQSACLALTLPPLAMLLLADRPFDVTTPSRGVHHARP